jgi:hypothetical protein
MTTDWQVVAASLRDAHDLIIDERNWCKGASARTRNGMGAHAAAPDAVAWCALGAIRRVATPIVFFDTEIALLAALGHVLPPGFYIVTDFNDAGNTTHADVLDLFLRAIKWAEEQA